MKLFKKRNRLFWSLLLSAFVMVCLNVRAADDDDDEELVDNSGYDLPKGEDAY